MSFLLFCICSYTKYRVRWAQDPPLLESGSGVKIETGII